MTNVVFTFRNREIGADTYRRNTFRCLRTLICKGNREFTKVWTRSSNKAWQYESGRILSDNYKVCHFGYGRDNIPRQMYKLPKTDTGKTEDALIYRCFHDNFTEFENRPCLVTLQSARKGESICFYDLDTGQLLKDIFLSQLVKFKYLSWIDPNRRFVVKSVSSSPERSIRFQRITGNLMTSSIVMAVFDAFPLTFVGMFEVDKRVFGPGIISASLSHGMLFVMYGKGIIRFFSFEYINEHYKLYDHDLDSPRMCSNGIVLEGLPMNIKITECPPVLFEVQCLHHDVKIGGHPWHCIFSPMGQRGVFQVASLKDKLKAQNGTLVDDTVDLEQDWCQFHPDNSGRILYMATASGSIRVLEIKELSETSGKYEIVENQVLDHRPPKQERLMMTSSGRTVKRSQSQDEISYETDVIIHNIDYEDDLDLTWTSATQLRPEPSNMVCFYDNQSNALLRKIRLDMRESCDIDYENNTCFDLDTIVHFVKPTIGKFICNLYRLSGDLNQGPAEKISSTSGTSADTCRSDRNRQDVRRRRRERR